MASGKDVNFTEIRPSPLCPHKPPKYIKPGNLDRSDSSSSNNSNWMELNQRPRDRTQTDVKTVDSEGERNPHFEFSRKSQTANGVINHNDVYLEERHESDNKKEDKKIWLCKLITGIIVVLVAIVGIVFFILYYTHPRVQEPKEYKLTATTQRPNTVLACTRSLEEIGFKDILSITCKLQLQNKVQLARLGILFKPRYGYFQSAESVYFELNESVITSSGWNITIYNQTANSADVVITKAPARCDSGGHYTLKFYNTNNQTILTHTEYIEIKSKVSDVYLQVQRNNESDSSTPFYEISCSAQSACTPAPIMLLGILTNGTSEPIFGVNFTCIINYNDNDGWTVKCSGTIPQNVYSSLNSIACRPTTGNETVDKEVEISYKICRECVFTCPPNDTDSYWYDPVICNIFHRCILGRLYTMPCSKQTYFNADTCSCDHIRNILDICNEKDERLEKKTDRNKCS